MSEQQLTVDDAIDQMGFGRFQFVVLVICGVIQAADAMEMLLLSVLGPLLSCEWKLSGTEIALITTAVFIGMMLGAPSLGYIADRYGRWSTLMLSNFIICYFGVLSAVSPSYKWMLFLRGAVGFAIGGLMAAVSSMFTEFMPSKWRGKGITMMMTFWSLGGLLEITLAMFVAPTLGWRWLLAFTAIPLFICFPLLAWMPKSPRYLLASGKPEAAMEVINRVARFNRHPEFKGPLQDPGKVQRGNICLMFRGWKYCLTSVLLISLWFICGFCYYGAVLVSSEFLRHPHKCLQDGSKEYTPKELGKDFSCACKIFSKSDYHSMLIATSGETLTVVWNFIFLDLIGRKATFALNNFLGALIFILLNLCVSLIAYDVLLFFLRTFMSAGFITAYVYTTEVYPTQIRTLGMGICSAMARVGAMTTPFVGQVMLPEYSVLGALCLYMALCLVGFIFAILLPIETRGRSLKQTVESSSTESPNELTCEELKTTYSTFGKKEK